ncbi:calcium-binding protein [Inquilinus sp. YAF38]|uniref:calcium-binding protein n=1 Tax=Inquilinus sp. YAF38 TaxID=3233084 RepID=UPI003F901698
MAGVYDLSGVTLGPLESGAIIDYEAYLVYPDPPYYQVAQLVYLANAPPHNIETNIIGTVGDDKIYGYDLALNAQLDSIYIADDRFWGFGGDDLLSGAAGNDVLYGQAGGDTLVGGDGDDWLIGGTGADVLNGGAGTDTANYAEAGAGVTLSLLAGIGTGGDAAGDSLVSVEHVIGSAFDDLIKGSAGADGLWGMAGADRLYGGDGADTLVGGEGNDYLTGGTGADVLSGGNGVDVALYDSATASVKVSFAAGAGSAGDAAGDTYNNVENVVGSAFNDTLTGSAGANALWGMNGADVLTGGGGADALKGGLGADRFAYSAAADSTAAARDSINDFSHAEGDRIDLAAIDADGNGANGNTAFSFLGAGAFTGAGHELRVTSAAGVQFVQADLNGDKVTDMVIGVVSTTGLVVGDFML